MAFRDRLRDLGCKVNNDLPLHRAAGEHWQGLGRGSGPASVQAYVQRYSWRESAGLERTDSGD